ncbi:MAG TPA: hypothetical protein VGH40_09475 [Roseiarcus sp.]
MTPSRIPNESAIAAVHRRESALYARFNRRAMFVALLALYVQLGLIFAHLLAGASLLFSLFNLLFCLSALAVARFESELLVFVLATNANWVFSFSAYVYSTSHLRLVDDKLFGAEDSIGLAFDFHLGCVVAYAIFRLLWQAYFPWRPDLRTYDRALALGSYKNILLVVGVALQLLNGAIPNPTLSAFASQFSSLLWLGLAFHFMSKGRFVFDLKTVAFLVVFAFIASLSNGRTILILAIFFIALCWIYYADRLLRVRYLVAIYLGFGFLNVFSDIVLDLRLNQRDVNENRSVESVVSKLVSLDNVEALINPFHKSASAASVDQRSYVIDYNNAFVMPYYSGVDSLSARFVALPMLDSVCGRYHSVDRVAWGAIGNMMSAILPNVGQEKDLIYSDRLTWELGLRDYGNVGRPEVTNACELYTMVGGVGLFFVSLVEFLLALIQVELLKNLLAMPALWIAVIPQVLVWMTVSTTALASAAYLARGIPLTILSVWLLYRFAAYTRARSPRTLVRSGPPSLTLNPDL